MFIKDKQGNVVTGERLEAMLAVGRVVADENYRRLMSGEVLPTADELHGGKQRLKDALMNALDEYDAKQAAQEEQPDEPEPDGA